MKFKQIFLGIIILLLIIGIIGFIYMDISFVTSDPCTNFTFINYEEVNSTNGISYCCGNYKMIKGFSSYKCFEME